MKYNKLWRQIMVLDTECTHAQPDQAEIVELAVATWDQEWSYEHSLFGSKQPMPPEASAVTHIHPDWISHLSTFDQSMEQVVPMLVKDQSYFVSHNVNYDRHVLMRNLENLGNDLVNWVSDPDKWICTLRLSRRAWPHMMSHAQTYLRYALDLDVDQNLVSHRAWPDTQVCVSLFMRLVDELVSQGLLDADEDLAPQLVRLTQAPIPVTTWPFGKHKGKAFGDLDTDYLLWCVDNLKYLDPQDVDHDADLSESVRAELERRL